MPKNNEERDKLLQELAYLEQAEYIDKQIYAQLVEIVEQYYSEPDSDTQEELLDGMEKMLNYYGREEWYYKDLINQLVKIVEQHFEYAKYVNPYRDDTQAGQSTESVKDTAQKTVGQSGEVDEY